LTDRCVPAILACVQSSTATKQAVPSEELVGSLAAFLHYIFKTCGPKGGMLEVIDELGLSLTQLKAIQLMVADPASEMSVKQLGDSLELSLPAISRAVDGLVHRGLVTRTEDEEDRRIKRVRPTKEADQLVARLIDIRFSQLGEFVDTLSPRERNKLAAALAVLAEREDIAELVTQEHAATSKNEKTVSQKETR
jgi:DNA-binding MarR family transcriptional regulator